MGYWGWRPLILSVFISVWIIGCTVTHEIAPTQTPTEYPQITLTVRVPRSPTPVSALPTPLTPTFLPPLTPEVEPSSIYLVQPGDTLLGIALRFGIELSALQAANPNVEPLTLQIGQELIIPNSLTRTEALLIRPTATPLALFLPAPTCYETQTGNLLCLGRVDNLLTEAVEQVRVHVRVLRPDGTLLAAETVDLDQRVVPPGKFAPYRVQFAPTDGLDTIERMVVTASLLRANAAPRFREGYLELDLSGDSGAMSGAHYVVSATLANLTGRAAESIRLVATLYDGEGRVAGFRVVQTNWTLAAGESRQVTIPVIPQARVAAYTLYAEAAQGG